MGFGFDIGDLISIGLQVARSVEARDELLASQARAEAARKEAEEQRLVSFGKDFESDEKETKDRPLSPFERKQRCLSKYGNPAICCIPCRP